MSPVTIYVIFIAVVGIGFSIWIFVSNARAKRETDRLFAEYKASMEALMGVTLGSEELLRRAYRPNDTKKDS